MGAGVALFDYDNDGRLDIYFTNGARLQDPMPKNAKPDKSDARFWNRLYRQLPSDKSDLKFEDVTEKAGVKGAGYSMGVAAGDFDGDGYADLYVTAYGGSNQLYRNRGDGTFEDVTTKTNTAVEGWSTSAGWLDYDADGRLDLFIARYMEWDFGKGSIYCGEQREGMRAYCHPDNFAGATNILFRQKADGTFEDVSAKVGITDFAGKGLGVAFADFNGDGWTDIFVANDSVRQSLYLNRHIEAGNTFENIALASGVGYDENGKTFAGMGVDAADYDGDGQPDVIVTALSNETYPLFRNNADESFTYTTNSTGIGQITLLYSGWGARFLDFDLDGRRDIFIAQGHVLDTIEKSSSYLQYKQPPLLLHNAGKNFVAVNAGSTFNQSLAARGASMGDLDNDGDTDIAVAVTDGAPVVLRNDGTKNHWVGFQLVGTKPNRQGVGARVTITDESGRKQIADVSTAGSYLSSHDSRVVFGLGANTTNIRTLDIRWANGQTQSLPNIGVDKYHVINER